MKIRQLEPSDLEALSSFISDSYDDYPIAMWFSSKPAKEEIERIFYNKIKGIASGFLADLVVEEKGKILGECEVVRTYTASGVVGIVIRKDHARSGIGTKLLLCALKAAKEIGMDKISAEVASANKGALRFFIVNGFAPLYTNKIEKNGKKEEAVLLEKKLK